MTNDRADTEGLVCGIGGSFRDHHRRETWFATAVGISTVLHSPARTQRECRTVRRACQHLIGAGPAIATCNGLQWKGLRTAINGNLGLHYGPPGASDRKFAVSSNACLFKRLAT